MRRETQQHDKHHSTRCTTPFHFPRELLDSDCRSVPLSLSKRCVSNPFCGLALLPLPLRLVL